MTWSTDNIDQDPRFRDSAGGDLSLLADSPCLDIGDAGALEPDSSDLDDDGDVNETIPVDHADADRVAGCNLDLGALEFQSGSAGSGDFDGGGLSHTDVPFFVSALLNAEAPTSCIADMNSDGSVDGLDAAAFVTALIQRF